RGRSEPLDGDAAEGDARPGMDLQADEARRQPRPRPAALRIAVVELRRRLAIQVHRVVLAAHRDLEIVPLRRRAHRRRAEPLLALTEDRTGAMNGAGPGAADLVDAHLESVVHGGEGRVASDARL